jgi:chromosome segregation ATPase
MSTRTKHQELEDELGILRSEVRAIGAKQDAIEEQIDAVHVHLKHMNTLERKLDKVEGMMIKSEQTQSDMFDYLKRLEGKITCPPSPVSITPSADYMVHE